MSKDIMKCGKCGHVQFATYGKCGLCNGELIPASPEEIENLQTKYQKMRDEADERVMASLRNRQDTNTPKCPVCQSPRIKEISIAKRATHGFVFGLFSTTARSQWECLNCGNKF